MTLSTLVVSPLELTQRLFSRRSLLPLNSNHLWRIEAGVIRAFTWQEDGTSIALGLWGPGDVVGRALSSANPLQLECLTEVRATLLPPERWHEATEAMVLHSRRSGELLEILHCRNTHASLLKLLNWLANRFGHEVERGRLISLRLTHQDLAELMGSTRVTVTRLLKDFEQQGLIHRDHRRFILLQEHPPFWHYEI